MRISTQLNVKRLGKSLLILATYVGISVVSLSGANAAAPVFTSSTSFSINENSTAVGTVVADPGVVYSILPLTTHPSSLDASFFTIDPSNGDLSISARNFEIAADSGANNIYNVVVRADSGTSTTDQILVVTILNVNEAPVISTNGGGDTATITKAENSTSVTTVSADDPDSGTVKTYSINGADAGQFAIDSSTGVLTMTAQNFESPLHGNTLEVNVSVSDGLNTDSQTITVTITDVNETAPIIDQAEGALSNTNENISIGSLKTTITATDSDTANTITFSLSGTDAASFAIDTTTGIVAWAVSPNFELKSSYSFNVVATDNGVGNLFDTNAYTVAINDLNDNFPVFTSNGGGDTATVSADENVAIFSTAISNTATDADSGTVIHYSLTGIDAASFAIDTNTGTVIWRISPDFESKNTYSIIIEALDADTQIDSQTVTISITDVNEFAPIFNLASSSLSAVNENVPVGVLYTFTATDSDTANTIVYSLSGTDAGKFNIDTATGAVSWKASPNFEVQSYYEFSVTATDNGVGTIRANTNSYDVAINDLNDNTPVITRAAGSLTAVVENVEIITPIYTFTATDADTGTVLTYSLSGTDAAFFAIDETGTVTWLASPNFEARSSYSFDVVATDGLLSDTNTYTIAITDVNEATPVITLGSGALTAVNENVAVATVVNTFTATDADTANIITYSLSGTDAASFAINETGTVTWAVSPNYEAQSIYSFDVVATDGLTADTNTYTVAINDLNDNTPVITLGSGALTAVNENVAVATVVNTFTATDADTGTVLTYSLSGTDAASFAINETGTVTWLASPNYEAQNNYSFDVVATDGLFSDTNTYTIAITDVNEAPTFNVGVSDTATVAENETFAKALAGIDPDSDVVSFTVVGGADSASFEITGGNLVFVTSPDFENPTDVGLNNTYEVIVRISDGVLFSDKLIIVTVSNINAPIFTSTTAITINENAVGNILIVDTDKTVETFSIIPTINDATSADAALFAIDLNTGALTFLASPNFESPTDQDRNNIYVVRVIATVGGNEASAQTIYVTINGLNDNSPVITSDGGGDTATISVAENLNATITTLSSTDGDTGTVKVYSKVGGADASAFNLDPTTGVLTWDTVPNFELPGDFDLSNTYEVIVGVSDGLNSDTQTINVTVTDVNEFAPVITSDGGADTATVNVAENATSVTTVTSSDGDLGATATYSIVSGEDDGYLFAIDTGTGVLTMTAQNFENPAHDGNTLLVVVRVSDGANTFDQAITVTITDLNDNSPVITSDGGADTATTSTAENLHRLITTVTSEDLDAGASVSISIIGGADAAFFAMFHCAGCLSWETLPDFEAPADFGNNNTYEVIVQVSDGVNTDTQTITVTITDVNDNTPIITLESGALTAVTENVAIGTAINTFTATDSDTANTITYSLSGSDAASFAIDTSTGAVTWAESPNFEVKLNYSFAVVATDGLTADSNTYTIAITDVDDTPPAVGWLTSSATDGSYVAGNVIDIQITFTETVTVTGVPTLALNTGVEGRTATYLAGSGSTVLTFRYVVGQGDLSADLQYVGVASLTVTSASITDAAGNFADTTLPSIDAELSLGGIKAIAVDATAPTGLNVTPGAGSLTISVTQPSWNASLYTFEVSSDSGTTWLSIVSAQKSVTFGGLTAGLGYLVRVAGLSTVPNIALVSASQHVAGAYVTSGRTKFEPTSVAGPAGPAGDTGTAGAPGAPGAAGDTGTAGAPGAPGAAGAAGASGGSGAPGAAAINPQATLLLVFANSSVAATLTSSGTLTGGTGAGAVTFSTTDEKICTVSNLGVVTGVKVGECAIVATKAASAGYLEAKSNPVVLKVTDSPADVAAAKAKADADAAAVAKAKADADAAAVAKAKADADAAAVAKAKADADAAAKAKADADAVAAKIAEAKAQADAAVKAAADAKAATEKATADAKAAADLAAATAQAKADSDAAIAKIASANAMTIGVRSKTGYTTIKTDLADKYSGMKAVVQLIVVKSGKTTYVTLGTIYLDELGKGSTKTKTVIAKGQKVRVTVAGKVIKTVTK